MRLRVPRLGLPFGKGAAIPRWFFALVPQKLGLGLTMSLLPLFAVRVAGGNVADVGAISAVASMASVPGYVLWGNLSDQLGRRKPFLFLGLAGFVLANLLLGLSRNVGQIMALVALEGLLVSAIAPVSSALVLDHIPEDQWPDNLGRFNQIGGWSFVGGSVLGTLWLAVLPGWVGNEAAMRGLFVVGGVVAALSLVLTLWWLREPLVVRSRRPFDPRLLGHLAVSVVERALGRGHRTQMFVFRPAFLRQAREQLGGALGRYCACSFVLFLGINTGFTTFSIFLLDSIGASSAQIYLLSLIKNSMDALWYRPMGRIVRRQGGFRLLSEVAAGRIAIFAIFAVLAAVQPGLKGLWIVAVLQVFTGVTWAGIAVSGTTAAAQLSPKGLEGRSLGLYNAILSLGGILGSLLSGYLAQNYGYVATFSTAAVVMAVSSAWLWRLGAAVPQRRQRVEEAA